MTQLEADSGFDILLFHESPYTIMKLPCCAMRPDATLPAVAALNVCTLKGSGLKRDSKLDPRDRPQGYEESFDAYTLWYDAIQIGRRLQLFCPKLNNLAAAVRSARWTIDDKPAYLRRIRFCRFHDTIELIQVHPQSAQQLTVSIGSWSGHSKIASPQPELFAGCNTAIVMNKNNHLDWIADFLRFHIYHHKLESAIFMDNGSTLYDLQDLQDTICQADLQTALIISVPLKFGPRFAQLEKPYMILRGKIFNPEKYLQTALLNIVRLRYLSQARAVLNCDIDELAYTPTTTIFDLAVRNPLGIASLAAVWRYSSPTSNDPTRHACHHFKHRVLSEPCHAKYCIVPSGIMSWFPLFWNLHWLELEQHENHVILSYLSYRFNHALNHLFKISSLLLCPGGKFWHCRSTTTGWKSYRKAALPPDKLTPDTELQAALDVVFRSPESSISS